MARRLVSRIPVFCVVSAFIGVLLIFHTPLVLAQELSFSPVVTYETGGEQASSVAVADVNGDGKPDLLVAHFCSGPINCDGFVGVLLGNGDGTFQPAVTYSSGGQYASAVVVADANGDGKPDMLVTTNVYTCCTPGGAV